MAEPLITTLIDGPDNLEIVRDQIAAIILLEQKNQQVLAEAAGKDPRLFALRVFTERSNPWGEFQNANPDPLETPPIINVYFESNTTDWKASNRVARQKVITTYNIDCLGYGVSRDDGDGHVAGDKDAALTSQRATRLVRNILMAGAYTYLDLGRGENQIVWTRGVQGITEFIPQIDNRDIQQVVGNRIAFQVEHNELSPQVESCRISGVFVEVRRQDSGEILFEAEFPPSVRGAIEGKSTIAGKFA